MIVVLVTAVTQVTDMPLELFSYLSYRVYIGATSYFIESVYDNRLGSFKSMSKGYQNAFT
jgi:hypothetical protein